MNNAWLVFCFEETATLEDTCSCGGQRMSKFQTLRLGLPSSRSLDPLVGNSELPEISCNEKEFVSRTYRNFCFEINVYVDAYVYMQERFDQVHLIID